MFKSYVIVLDRDEWGQDLADDAISSGIQLGWKIEKFPAIDGRGLDVNTTLQKYNLQLDKRHKKQYRAMQRPGVFGNFLSHYHLWKRCVESGEPIGCFEHDVIFNYSPNCIDMAFENLLKLDRLIEQKYYSTGRCWQGAHAYILKPKGAKKLLKWVSRHGAVGADILIGTEVVQIEFDQNNLIKNNPKQILNRKGIALKSTSKTNTF